MVLQLNCVLSVEVKAPDKYTSKIQQQRLLPQIMTQLLKIFHRLCSTQLNLGTISFYLTPHTNQITMQKISSGCLFFLLSVSFTANLGYQTAYEIYRHWRPLYLRNLFSLLLQVFQSAPVQTFTAMEISLWPVAKLVPRVYCHNKSKILQRKLLIVITAIVISRLYGSKSLGQNHYCTNTV